MNLSFVVFSESEKANSSASSKGQHKVGVLAIPKKPHRSSSVTDDV